MPGFDDIEPTVKLNDGESFVGIFDRSKDVRPKETATMGTRYSFLFFGVSPPYTNRVVRMNGGARLYEGILKAMGENKSPMKLKITQHGAKGGLDSKVDVEAVK